MANFKKVKVGNFFKEDHHTVEIETPEGIFRIIPTDDGKGLKISLRSDSGIDQLNITPKATNMIEIR